MKRSEIRVWRRAEQRGEVALRVFCFAYAGASARIFHSWSPRVAEGVDVCPVELPGRGIRFAEALRERVPHLVSDLIEPIIRLADRPFALFGHSLGATLAFEVARALRREYGVEPNELIVSGRRAPRVPLREAPIHHLPDEEFLLEVRKLNGIPDAVWRQVDLMSILLPVLRADFAAAEKYQPRSERPLACPITAWGGDGDVNVLRSDLEAWREETSTAFSVRMFHGDHFFLHTAEIEVCAALSAALSSHVDRGRRQRCEGAPASGGGG